MILLVPLLLSVAQVPRPICGAPKSKDRHAAVHPVTQQQYYFWNEITGELQWEGTLLKSPEVVTEGDRLSSSNIAGMLQYACCWLHHAFVDN